MDKQKKHWSKPMLIVLNDWKPDEFALLQCVGRPGFPDVCGENTARVVS